MTIDAHLVPRSPDDFPHWQYAYLDIEYDTETESVWMCYKIDSPHSYTERMLKEIANIRESLRALFESKYIAKWPIRYFIMTSNKKNIFSFGGDLSEFVNAIRERRLDVLYHYGHLAIDVIYGLTAGFDLPIVTVSAVSGQCLGGGFEGALTTDFLIADEDAKLGVPEISFNTFPGMGAVSLLARRIGFSLAEQVVSSGNIYSAAEMQDLGVVNIVAAAGALRETTLDWLREGGEERWCRRRALVNARRRFSPLTHEELIRIVELWAECSHSITTQDLRYMERLVAAQKRIKSISSEAARKEKKRNI